MAALEPRIKCQRGRGRAKTRDTDEYDMQCGYFGFMRLWAKHYPVLRWIYAVPNGAGMLPGEGAKQVLSGLTAGVWDICVPIPKVIQTFNAIPVYIAGMYIEFKTDDGELSPEQEEFAKAMQARGFVCLTFLNWKEAARATIAHAGIRDARIDRDLEGK